MTANFLDGKACSRWLLKRNFHQTISKSRRNPPRPTSLEPTKLHQTHKSSSTSTTSINGQPISLATSNTYHQTMRLLPIILAAASPLAGLSAPIPKSLLYPNVLNTIIISAPASSPICNRRWRHHGSHLAFRLSRLHTCCPGPEPVLISTAVPLFADTPFRGASVSGVVPRGRL